MILNFAKNYNGKKETMEVVMDRLWNMPTSSSSVEGGQSTASYRPGLLAYLPRLSNNKPIKPISYYFYIGS